jgi:hypothetical protein
MLTALPGSAEVPLGTNRALLFPLTLPGRVAQYALLKLTLNRRVVDYGSKEKDRCTAEEEEKEVIQTRRVHNMAAKKKTAEPLKKKKKK